MTFFTRYAVKATAAALGVLSTTLATQALSGDVTREGIAKDGILTVIAFLSVYVAPKNDDIPDPNTGLRKDGVS